MVSTGLLLSVAVAFLSIGGATAFHLPGFEQRGLQESSMSSSMSSSGLGNVLDPNLLMVHSTFEETTSGTEAECASPPIFAGVVNYPFCSPAECGFFAYADSGVPLSNISTAKECGTDLNATVDKLLEGGAYLRLDGYADADCATWLSTELIVVDGKCHAQSLTTIDDQDLSFLTTLNTNGSITWMSFISSDCSGEARNNTVFEEHQLSSSSCTNKIRASTNAEGGDGAGGTGNGSGGMRSVGGAASRLAVAGVAILGTVLLFVQ